MFTVLRYLFTTDAPEIQAVRATLEEAKIYVEQQIVVFRKDITKKWYFAYAIVDMRTAKLVDAVIEAPPPIKWTGEQVMITSERTIRPNLIADDNDIECEKSNGRLTNG